MDRRTFLHMTGVALVTPCLPLSSGAPASSSVASTESIVRVGDVFAPISPTWSWYEVVVEKVTRADTCLTFPEHGIGQYRWNHTEHPIVITGAIGRHGPDSLGRRIMPGFFALSANFLLKDFRLIGRNFHAGINPISERVIEISSAARIGDLP